MRRLTVMLVGAFALCGVATGAHAQNKCQGAKIKDAYGKLEAKPGCNTTGDATAIENKVDAFTNDVNGELNVGATTTTTATTSTTTTTAGPTKLSFTTTVGTTSCGSAGFLTT